MAKMPITTVPCSGVPDRNGPLGEEHENDRSAPRSEKPVNVSSKSNGRSIADRVDANHPRHSDPGEWTPPVGRGGYEGEQRPEGRSCRRHHTCGGRRGSGVGGSVDAASGGARRAVKQKAEIVALLRPGRIGWSSEEWRAFFDERASIAEFDGGLPRAQPGSGLHLLLANG